jgi:hypothetical protein
MTTVRRYSRRSVSNHPKGRTFGSTRRAISVLGFLAMWGWGATALAYRDPPPDASQMGPNSTVAAEYRLPASIDPDIIDGRFTEVWARVYRPDPLPDNSPLLVFLHGNHGTCGRCITGTLDDSAHCTDGSARHDDSTQYTSTGTCPANYAVTPNHVGYTYITDLLASWGYLVVSINVNRGINGAGGITGDSGLNLTRGRMVLRHLELLSRWNQGIDPTPDSLGIDLTGKIDFTNVGLLGHSRGGEGMRAALQQYRDTGSIWPPRIGPVTFLGMFEIGPVDGQTSRILTPDNVAWEVLLPMCDGDVSDLQGVRPYDRVRYVFTDNPATRKGSSTVYGANHNYFNSEWQQSDSSGCTGPNNPRIFDPSLIGSPQQQQVAKSLAMAMFRGAVGPGASDPFLDIFDPFYSVPSILDTVTRVDRGFTFSPSATVSLVLENFASAGTFTSSGLTSFQVETLTGHDAARRVGLITWNAAGGSLESDFAAGPMDISSYTIFEFDSDRQQNALNPVDATNFHIQLVQADTGTSDPLSANSYAVIDGPQGGPGGQVHAELKTARIPLTDFTNVDLTQIAGVRFTFDDTNSGAIFLSTIAVDNAPPAGGNAPVSAARANAGTQEATARVSTILRDGNATSGVRLITRSDLGRAVAIDLNALIPHPPKDELSIAQIGNEEFELIEYRDGDPRQLSVIMTEEQFAQLPSGTEIRLKYGRGDGDTWVFPAAK